MDIIEQEKHRLTKPKRIAIIFSQTIGATITAIFTVIIAALLLYIETSDNSYVYWAIIITIINSVRFIVSKRFIRATPPVHEYPHWSRYYWISAFLSGASWASLLAIDISPLPIPLQLLTFLLLAFIGFVGITSYSPILNFFYIFISTLFSISVILILTVQEPAYFNISLFFVLIFPILLTTAKSFNTNLINSLSKQIQVEKLLNQVEYANELLEEKVIERTSDLIDAKDAAEHASNAKSDFLANMTHELRTPLHAILSFSKLGSRKKDTNTLQKVTGYCNKIHTSGVRLLELMDNLLELSRFDGGHVTFVVEKAKIADIIEDTVSELESLFMEKSIVLDIDAPNEEIDLLIDQTRIGQVIKNLLGNAIKFSPINGHIKITTLHQNMIIGRRDTDAETQPAFKFSILDEGTGIPENELSMIFDKFSQSSTTKTGAGGTGLGLAISREIVEGHGGKIWAENNIGDGSSFHFMIPLQKGQSES